MFGNGSAAESSRPTALREAGANGSGGSRPDQHIPDTNTPGCPYQKGQTHNGSLSDRGGDRAAAMYSLIYTAKLNDVDPRAWLADVLARIADHPASRLHELLPWNWRKAQETVTAAEAA